jgi:hypothetical protein
VIVSGFTRSAIFADLIGRGRPLVQFARSASFGSTPQDNFDRAVARNLDPSYVCAGSLCSFKSAGHITLQELQGPRPIHHSIVRVAAG